MQCHEERILDPALYAPFVQLMLVAVENPTVSNHLFDGLSMKESQH